MKCRFCGAEIKKGTGILHVYKDGTIYPFCSRKCETNFLKLKRKPQRVKWTARYHEEKEIRMHGKEEKVKKEKKEKVKKKATRAERKTRREAKKAEKKKVKAAKKKQAGKAEEK